ncbi:MAG: bleomycin resistance family protein [Bacteroidetes bacterium]|nr:MAG: bleomycin resistance family protein [Bacteroidota bacterium]
MIQFQSLTPNLLVTDVNATIDFYKQNFGFEIQMFYPETGNLVWAMIAKDNIAIMIQEKESILGEYPELKNRTLGGSQTFYINVVGIEEIYAKLTQNGVSILIELRKTVYDAKEFAIKDLNGYILTFAQGKTE